ncbi:MAG: hypothetical protein LCH81_00950 [Bacteroidetes bacterium]|nr:hypothetical protein [Bacteroidota bacterium]
MAQTTEKEKDNSGLALKIYRGLRRHHGAIATLAERRSCTPEWCRVVLQGKGNDVELLEEAAKLWDELETKLQKRVEQINQTAEKAERRMVNNLQIA